MSTEVLYTFFITCFLLIITPGPDILYVVSQSITRGRKYGYAIVVGQMGGLLFHLSLFAFGVSALITQSELLFKGVKLFGALYLFWLSYKVFQEENVIVIDESTSGKNDKTFMGFVRKGLLMNVMNPKVMMFFLALFPGFITEAAGSVQKQVFVLGSVFIAEAVVIFFIICSVAAKLTNYMKDNKSVNLFLKWLQIIVFSGLGVYLLVS
ncbi:LysE family translocator [Myroides marinus]|uniref:Lysine transporter LysE n=1 Tax=Myroides marinus TaxID=703342 RepID=A0A163ZL71_9FLAO|nr:LysE family translocator [Myroides marinus]KZE81990.1 lysine transporter LysE [Myroides marinus]MDM1348412.1 LysE family translocator [Myroides marinus]MDM1351905.1 LysE family translocator [Myroides marinus]MDM1353576.1 LysE family translocator [Myroides marinus]MDM1359132.1 LysE family translocator [Myroides marinus]